MRRRAVSARWDWKSKLESQGLPYHTHEDGLPYWREEACYVFSRQEIKELETAVTQLQSLCLKAVEHVLAKDRFAEYGIPAAFIPMIRESWERDEVSIYGRFDLAFDGEQAPKLLEYNADTPTSLVEAAIAQWFWLEDQFPGKDQFNSLHERLVEAWRRAAGYLPVGTIAFLYQDTWEDHQTVAYLRNTADLAGLSTLQMPLEDLGWDPKQRAFVDLDERPVRAAFKLYPWEFMWQDAFAPHLLESPRPCTFLEPAWKMLLSNKALLAVLWELFPESPYLLPAYLDGPRGMTDYVKKPILAREGANVEIHGGGQIAQGLKNPCYGSEGYVYQTLAKVPNFEGHYPILGTWVVDGEAAGMGVRESQGLITDNQSAFVPHFIEG